MSKKIELPSINLVSKNVHRPFWSVMIPTYNGTKYLEQTLKSVLAQDPGTDEMQIEVVDDCSTKDDPEELVKDIGQGRVSFFRNPKNVGLLPNWDTCIQRANGHWVHILHQDDIVLPGFYDSLKKAAQTDLSVGAAFCRHMHMDEDGHWIDISLLERKTPGILENWIEQIAIKQRIQFASIVVKRSTYETLGGFCPEAASAADWEMWKRIAAHYSIWYEPQPLACYRLHSASETSQLVKLGKNIADSRESIEISKSYLPKSIAQKVSIKARKFYANYALDSAQYMLFTGHKSAAINQIGEAFKCSYSLRILMRTIIVFQWYVVWYIWKWIRQI